MNIALCDDEPAENERLKGLIYAHAAARNYDILCDTFTSAAELLAREKYDVYFLDYAMPGMSGAELAVRLKEKFANAVTVCFLTSYERAAVEVINRGVNAEAFLVKPAEPARVNALLDRLYARSGLRRVVLKKEKTMRALYVQDILYVEAQNKECRVRFYNGEELFPYKITELEENCLPKQVFFRVHRSYLVNLMHVSAFDKTCVTLKNGDVIPMRRYKAFCEAFSAFGFEAL